jgi:pyruvate dehydrogenase E1 component alpha subunit
MLLIRRFEEKAAEMYALGKIGGFCHLYIGQEAVAVGAMAAIRPDDYVLTSYREHGEAIVKGADPKRVLAELFGRIDGVSKGKGGSMHLFDKKVNFLGGHAIVGAHIPLATGVGFAINYQKQDKVCLCFFGEGAINQGAFHESLNLAVLWKLPVVYICENNRYAMGTPLERATSLYDLAEKACAYDMPREHIDGMNVLEVYEHVNTAVERARKDKIPTLIEARTYRYRGHSMADPSHGHYRTKEELEDQKKRDPILLYREYLEKEKVLTGQIYQEMEQKIKKEMEEVVAFADASPMPSEDEIYKDVYVKYP